MTAKRHMWKDRRLCDLFGIEHPILQAPMAGATNAALAAAVSEAGALGGLGAAAITPQRLRAVLAEFRQRTTGPLHLNLFAPQTEGTAASLRSRPLGEGLVDCLERMSAELDCGAVPEPKPMFGPAGEQLEVALELGIEVLSFHFGCDEELLRRAQDTDTVVLCSATSVAEARQLDALGVDAIIAQGAEAGGHRGTFIGDGQRDLVGTLALVPAVVDAVKVPVIAAGGIMDGRGILAALALGASGVQLGTAFLGCREAPIAQPWGDALEDATATDTVVTAAISGKPARGLRNRLVEELEAVGRHEPLLPYPAQYSLSRSVRAAAQREGRAEFMAMWAGQGVDLFSRTTAAELVQRLVSQTRDAHEAV